MAKRHNRPPSPMTWIRYGFEFLLLIVLSVFAAILPWALTWRIGRGLGWLAFHLVPIRHKVLESNLKRAFPEMDAAERRRLGLACTQHWGEGLVSTLKLWLLSKRKVKALVDAPELDQLLLDAREADEPILFFTGHFGSWEMAGRYVCDFNDGGSSIYRVQKNPLSEWYLTAVRSWRKMWLVDSHLGMNDFIDALRRTRALAVVGDQYKRTNAAEIQFFGIPSPTPKGIAILTFKARPWLVFLASFQHRGRYRIEVERVHYQSPETLTEDWTIDLIQGLTDQLEAVINRAPEQYFWFHKRWR